MNIKITLLIILSSALPVSAMDADGPGYRTWLTYGQYEECSPGNLGHSRGSLDATVLRTFYAGLFKQVQLAPLPYRKDDKQMLDYLTVTQTVLNIYRTALLTAACIKKLACVCRAIAINDGVTTTEKDTLFGIALEKFRFFKQQEPFQYSYHHWNVFTMLGEFQILKPSDFIVDDLD